MDWAINGLVALVINGESIRLIQQRISNADFEDFEIGVYMSLVNLENLVKSTQIKLKKKGLSRIIGWVWFLKMENPEKINGFRVKLDLDLKNSLTQ